MRSSTLFPGGPQTQHHKRFQLSRCAAFIMMNALMRPQVGAGKAVCSHLATRLLLAPPPCAVTRDASTDGPATRGEGRPPARQFRGVKERQTSQADEELLPHRRAAARRAAESSVQSRARPADAQPALQPAVPSIQGSLATGQQTASQQPPESVYPTFVPRPAGVGDGPWNNVDVSQLRAAEQDADAAVSSKKVDSAGFVLLGKTLPELEEFVVQQGLPKYRAKQLLDGIMQGARTLDEIKNLPKAMKATLQAAGVKTGRSILHKSVTAQDGTTKFLLQLHDGRILETVGIPNDSEPTVREGDPYAAHEPGDKAPRTSTGRLTVCVSSQVGCPMRCSFCATGKGGFARNLMPHEIIDQVLTVREVFGRRVSNVVFMGMGEPLLNVPSVVKSYQLLNEQLGISGRSITVSTVGVPNAIRRLAHSKIKSTLAVSIHAPNQTIRESIIPSAKAYPIEALLKDCAAYFHITGRRVTFEYTLLSGVNDAPEHARELASLLRSGDLFSHVNLIPWNAVDDAEFVRPSRNRVYAFVRELEAAGLTTTVRITRGLDAAAACGQLRNMHQKEPLPEFAVPA